MSKHLNKPLEELKVEILVTSIQSKGISPLASIPKNSNEPLFDKHHSKVKTIRGLDPKANNTRNSSLKQNNLKNGEGENIKFDNSTEKYLN